MMITLRRILLVEDNARDRELKSGRIDVRRQATVQATTADVAGLADMSPVPAGAARIVEYRPNRVCIETDTAVRQFLVLSDVNYPGWRAYVDGHATPVLPTNGVFRGVSVPKGIHTVEFRFSPNRLRIGIALSLACLSGLIAATVLDRWISLRKVLPIPSPNRL